MNTNILNVDQKKFYQKNGYLVPSLKLETDFVEDMNIAVDKFLLNNPDITIERAACPHLPGGISNSQLIDEELSNKFLQFGFNKKIIKVVSEIIGDDGGYLFESNSKTSLIKTISFLNCLQYNLRTGYQFFSIYL